MEKENGNTGIPEMRFEVAHNLGNTFSTTNLIEFPSNTIGNGNIMLCSRFCQDWKSQCHGQ